MRIIFTLFLSGCFSLLQSQDMHCSNDADKTTVTTKVAGANLNDALKNRMNSCAVVEARQTPGVVLRCRPAIATEEPLYVIDGKLASNAELKALDPSTIESISILKDPLPYSCRSPRGVVIITTKQKYIRVMVNDADDLTAIGGATIKLVPVNDAGKINMTTAGVEGEADVKAWAGNYNVEISSVGYVTKKLQWNTDSCRNKIILVSMNKQFVQMNDVAVVGYTCMRRRDILSCGSTRFTKPAVVEASQAKQNIISSSVFPNPLLHGQSAMIDINAMKDELMQVRMLTLTGQQVLSFPAQVKAGINRFNIPAENKLAAGMYLVQVVDHKGKPIQTDKLIIQ